MAKRTAFNFFSRRLLSNAAFRERHHHMPLGGSYGGRFTVTMLPGDGVGPEVMQHVKQVFRYAGVPVNFEELQMDQSATDEQYEHALLALRRNGVALKGNVETDLKNPTFKSRNLDLRTELDLFANVIKVKNIPGIQTRHENIDIVIIRENTEGEYKQLEHEVKDKSAGGVVESLKIITREKSNRIAKYAFDYAVKNGRKKVTAVHKANIMKLGDGLFLKCCTEMAKQYPDIEFESMIVDNCSMQMVSHPEQFDVMVLPNLYGNIIANIGAGLIGGPGIVSGANIGQEYAVFETGTRNTGKNVAGKDIANPCAMFLASADMLEYLGLKYHSDLIKRSVYEVLSKDQIHTPDLGGMHTTTEVVQAVISHIQAEAKWVHVD